MVMFTFSVLDIFCKFCPKIYLTFWCYLINFPAVYSQILKGSGFSCINFTPKMQQILACAPTLCNKYFKLSNFEIAYIEKVVFPRLSVLITLCKFQWCSCDLSSEDIFSKSNGRDRFSFQHRIQVILFISL